VSSGTDDPIKEAPVAEAPEATGEKAAACDCRKVLEALTSCREAFGDLSHDERLAVVCTLAAELGVSVAQDLPREAAESGAMPPPENLGWAKEFVTQVVLSDALLGVAVQLDESKREIDDIVERLDHAAEDGSDEPG